MKFLGKIYRQATLRLDVKRLCSCIMNFFYVFFPGHSRIGIIFYVCIDSMYTTQLAVEYRYLRDQGLSHCDICYSILWSPIPPPPLPRSHGKRKATHFTQWRFFFKCTEKRLRDNITIIEYLNFQNLTSHIQKMIQLYQQNFCSFNLRIWLLYGRQNIRLFQEQKFHFIFI